MTHGGSWRNCTTHHARKVKGAVLAADRHRVSVADLPGPCPLLVLKAPVRWSSDDIPSFNTAAIVYTRLRPSGKAPKYYPHSIVIEWETLDCLERRPNPYCHLNPLIHPCTHLPPAVRSQPSCCLFVRATTAGVQKNYMLVEPHHEWRRRKALRAHVL